MIAVHSPIDMDGIAWTDNIANYIQDLSITFSGEGKPRTAADYGVSVLRNVSIKRSGDWGFSVHAIHPLTGNAYTAVVSDSGRKTSYPVGVSFDFIANIVADESRDIELSEVRILPTALCFIDSTKQQVKDILIPTNSPITSTIIGNTVSIEIDEQLNKYRYVEVDDSGIRRINGIAPAQGNINISGAGRTFVLTREGK